MKTSYWIVLGAIFVAGMICSGLKEARKSPEQKRKEKEMKQMAKYIADEINKNAWWI